MKKSTIKAIVVLVIIVLACVSMTSCFEILDDFLSFEESESSSAGNSNKTDNELDPFSGDKNGSNTVNLHVDVEKNLIFSKYDVEVFIDTFQQKLMTVKHGQSKEKRITLNKGTYKIWFRSMKDNSIVSNVVLDVDYDVNAYYSLHCQSDRLVVEPYKYEIKKDLENDEIRIGFNESDLKNNDISDVLSKLKHIGFTNIVTIERFDVDESSYSYHKVISVKINNSSDYADGSIFKKDSDIVIAYHESRPAQTSANTTKPEEKVTPASYHSSNNRDIAKQGNSGYFAYRNKGISYYIYYVIDFDNGFVYRFLNNEETAERVKIVSGDLNSYVLLRYKDGNQIWEEALSFKYKNKPEILILQDNDRFEWEFYSYDVSDAVKLLKTKKIVDYSAK